MPKENPSAADLVDDENAARIEAEVPLRGEPRLQTFQLRECAVRAAIDVCWPQARLCAGRYSRELLAQLEGSGH